MSGVRDRVHEQLDTLEQRLHDLQRQVQQLQRMASLGTMSAMIAHEFNNLLTPIITYTQFALGKDEPALLRTAVEKSNRNATRLAALCQRVLGFASNGPGEPDSRAIRPLLMEAVEAIGRDFEKDNIIVSIEAPEDLHVFACAAAVQQVLLNLVINAWQAMLDRPGRLTLSASSRGNDVEICVSDTGCGIAPENIERVFEPFFTTKTAESKTYRRGAGLGLHVCKQLVSDQNGSIRVSSEPGRGTTFTITLPRGQTNE